jgi:glycosyltransferase involved in cell wall biosynthesis
MTKFIQIIPGVCFGSLLFKEDYFFWPASMMKNKGYQVEFVTIDKGTSPATEMYEGIKILRFKNTFSLLNYIFLQKNALVHSHLRSYPPSLFVSIIKRKVIHTPHNYQLGSNLMVKLLTIFLFRRFEKILALTPYEKDIYLKNNIPSSKIVYVPHAIDYAYFSKTKKKVALARKLSITGKDFVIITVANYRKVKKMETLFKAFKTLTTKSKHFKLIVVGKDLLDQEGGPTLSEMIASMKLSNVTLAGYVKPEDSKDYYSLSHVFVNTSESESMCLAAYEAAAAGLPLCLSNIGSFTSVFSTYVKYHNYWDHTKLADNLLFYFNNPSISKLHAKSLKKLVIQFDYKYAKERMKKIYDEIISHY